MKNKFFIVATLLAILSLFAVSYTFATTNAVNDVRNAVGGAENVIEDDADVTWPEFKTHLEELIGRSKLGEAKKDSLLSTINDIADNDVTVNNADEGAFSISSVDDPNNVYAFEDKLFEILVGGQFNGERLCRYTSLYSLYRTINEQSQSMCSIVCMNDKT